MSNISRLLVDLGSTLIQSSRTPNMTRYDPHHKQVKFHKSTKKGRLYIGGNRAGKTTANVLECLWWMTKTHPYRPEINSIEEPIRGRLVCVDFGTLVKNIIPQFQQWTPKKYLIEGSWDKSYDKQNKILTLNNGAFIEFMSYDQQLDKFSGTSRHFISFDEEGPSHIFSECRARLVDTGGSWWISMTPLDGLTWVYEDIWNPWDKLRQKNKEDEFKYFVIQADMLDNPTISPEEAEEYLGSLDPKEREAREHGNFVQLGGRVFKNFDPKIHSFSFADFKLTPEMRVYTSVDVGWAHPTAWLWHAVEPDGHITTFHEMVESGFTIQDWSKRVLEFEKENKIQVFLRTGDPAMRQTRTNIGVSDISEYARNGIFLAVEGVPAGPGSVNIGLIKMEQYMRMDPTGERTWWRYTDNCTTLEDQMQRLRWATYASKKSEAENAPKGTIHKKDDDAPDSARYFFTLMPDLSFDADNKPLKSSYGALLDSVVQRNEPLVDINSFLEQPVESSWNVYNADSDWDLEGLGD